MRPQRAGAPRRVTVRVLGAVAVDGPDSVVPVSGRQPSSVLAFLALENRSVTHDELAELLWGQRPSRHWRGAVRGVLSKIRAALVEAGWSADVLQSDGTVIRLSGGARTDLDDIEARLAASTSAIDDVERTLAALEQPFLPNDDSDWGRAVRLRIANAVRRAHLARVDALVRAGRVDEAIDQLERAVVREPLDESLQHRLIALLVDTDRPAAASEAYEQFAKHLADEFGIAPPNETAKLLSRRTHREAQPGHTAGAGPAVLGGAMHPHSADPFVGRHRELERIETIWRDVTATSRPHVIILDGPAGIGKTRLADRFCMIQQQRNHVQVVLWGRNRGYGDRAFGAVAEMINRAVRVVPSIAERLDDDLAGLRPVLDGSELRTPDPVAAHGEVKARNIRGGLVSAIQTLLHDVAREPMIVVLDDLQWSPTDELDVVEAVLDGLQVPLLLIATTRHTPPEVADALARVQRTVDTTTIPLDGLTASDLGELFADPALAETITRRTGGLPFYASEIARVSRLEGRPPAADDVPPAIADWVRRRVRALDRTLAHLLELASVVGDDIDLDLLRRCSALSPDDVSDALDELVTVGLLTQGAVGTLQFSHEITREIVYQSIGPATLPHLHRRVGTTLASTHGNVVLDARLAHHFSLAGQDMRPQAAEYARRAGQRALTTGAWTRAAEHFTDAVELGDTVVERVEASIGLGRAWLGEERFADATAALTWGADLAEDHGLPVLSARAVLALVGRAGRGALHDEHDEEHQRLLRRALHSVSVHEPAPGSPEVDVLAEIRSDLERELAFNLLLSDAADERVELLNSSVARMRSLRPSRPRALANALLGQRYALLGPDQLDQRLAAIDEVLALGIDALGPDVVLAARVYQQEDLIRSGDLAGAERSLARAERLLATFPHPYWGWAVRTWRGLRQVIDGELDAAEQTVLEAGGLRPGVAAAAACLAVNTVNLRLYQQRSADTIPILRAAVAAHAGIPTYRAVLALALAEHGAIDEATVLVRNFAESCFTELPDDTNRFLGLAVLAHAAATVGAAEVAPALLHLLEPYRDQWVVLNCYGGGGAVWGPTAHALARLELLRGDDASAASSFDMAATMAAASPVIAARIAADRP